MTPSPMTTGDRVRDLLGSDPITVIEESDAGRFARIESRLASLGTAMGFIGDGLEDVRCEVTRRAEANGRQDIQIAVLRTRSALFGVIGGIVAAGVFELALVILAHWART